ncbi:MAG: alpha/beta fold hydrolase [Spartobacteria bacterium]|nr:alpha/beta fold hydrolase [Spartobacteria bacterium]
MKLKSLDYTPYCVAGLDLSVFGTIKDNAVIVFVLHGRNSCKEKKYDLCRLLADNGYVAVALDALNHGRRTVNSTLISQDTADTLVEILGVMGGTAQELSLLMDVLPAAWDMRPDAFAVMGTSLGGVMALLAASMDSRIKAVASLTGTGAFRELAMAHLPQTNLSYNAIFSDKSGALECLLNKYDPMQRVESLAQTHILLSAGTADETVPLSAVQVFFDEICRMHSHHKVVLREYINVGHCVTPEMQQDAVNWLIETGLS